MEWLACIVPLVVSNNRKKMQLPSTTFIAGSKTVNDWLLMKKELSDFKNDTAWIKAYEDYFLTRLKDRYLTPIVSIKENGGYTGEGFSIMTIICSLIEFLETTYKGINYRFIKHGDLTLGEFEYSKSRDVFIDFLNNRHPFCSQFNKETSAEFYSNVRCGLLHEARTNGKWIIRGKSYENHLIKKTETEIIVYRNNFYDSLLTFIYKSYKSELLSSNIRKEAFLRKFDKLCEE